MKLRLHPVVGVLLLPLSWLFGLGVWLRNLFFDIGVLSSAEIGVPVISVGNITAGGTGKTPLVEYVVRQLIARGLHPAVVSRGYGRNSSGVLSVSDGNKLLVDADMGGDEPVQMARNLPGAVVVVGERRVAAAQAAVEGWKANVIVLDDGFQHRYVKRDIDIVVLDSRMANVQEPLLPAGLKREPLSNLQRADVLALSRSNKSTSSEWTARYSAAPVIKYRYVIKGIEPVIDIGVHALPAGTCVVAFSGIGSHESFLSTLDDAGLVVQAEKGFGDHHNYTERDIEKIIDMIHSTDVNACVTTEKDMARLRSAPDEVRELLKTMPLWCMGINVEVFEGEDVLWSMIDNHLGDVSR